METLRRFRLLTVQLSLALTVAAGFACMLWSGPAGRGLLLGGGSGTLVFWITARRAERLAMLPANKVKSAAYGWTLLQTTIYLLALYRGYTLDPAAYHGLVGVVGGLFIVRIVVVFLGVTGLDLKQEKK